MSIFSCTIFFEGLVLVSSGAFCDKLGMRFYQRVIEEGVRAAFRDAKVKLDAQGEESE